MADNTGMIPVGDAQHLLRPLALLSLRHLAANCCPNRIVTKRGKPVAKLVPMPPKTELFGALAGSILAETDIVTPVDTEWEAAR